jgi:hypothetical protein
LEEDLIDINAENEEEQKLIESNVFDLNEVLLENMGGGEEIHYDEKIEELER